MKRTIRTLLKKNLPQKLAIGGGALLLLILPIIVVYTERNQNETTHAQIASTAPTSPPVTWCEDSNFPGDQSPYSSAPAGAVIVPAGNNSNASVNNSADNTTYWFAPGTHTGLSIITAKNVKYLGAPGAIIDGGKNTRYAFQGQYNDTADQNVTIAYLTIQNFTPDQGGGSVNVNGNNGWTESYNRMQSNSPGAAMMMGGNNVVSNNCLTNNGEYGAQGYSYVDENYEDTFTGGALNITFTGNDVSFNNTMRTQEGVEGGVKFWQNGNVIVTGNYFHDNILSSGLWADTDNAGFLIQNNYISNNGAEGLFYEISYNANIIDNTFVNNGITVGPTNPSFPTGAIYISESGGDSNVPSNYPGILNIQGNVFTDNWSGVVMYQNSNRYVGDGQDPGTLLPPSGTDMQTWLNTTGPKNCPSNLAQTSPINYNHICQWRVQNVTVQNNQFSFNPSDSVYGGKCTQANSCGQNAIFATFSSTPAYPTWTIPNAISNTQNNHFLNNTYAGPWSFVYFNQGDVATFTQWRAGISNVEGSGYNFGGQDAGSTFNGIGGSPVPSWGQTITSQPTQPMATAFPTSAPIPTATPRPTTIPVKPTATPFPVSGGNLLDANTSGMEGSLGKWVKWYSTSLARTTSFAHSGTHSMKVTVTAPYGWGIILNNWPGFAVTPGQKTVSVWALKGTKATDVTMQLQWINASRKVLQNNQVSVNFLSSSWQKTQTTVTAPAGTAYVNIDFVNNAPKGTIFYLDDISITN